MIVSAGAYQSPVLLMLSGIGPEDQLAPLGIEVRNALPVGEGLQDHCMAQLNYLTDEPSLFMAVTPENIALLESEGRGPLSSNIPEAGGFFRARPGLDAPDVEFHFAPSLFFDEGLTAPRRSRLLLRPGGDPAHQPRTRDAAGAPAGLQAARAVQLPDHARGPREHAGRDADRAGDRRSATAAGGRARRRSACPSRTPTRT